MISCKQNNNIHKNLVFTKLSDEGIMWFGILLKIDSDYVCLNVCVRRLRESFKGYSSFYRITIPANFMKKCEGLEHRELFWMHVGGRWNVGSHIGPGKNLWCPRCIDRSERERNWNGTGNYVNSYVWSMSACLKKKFLSTGK